MTHWTPEEVCAFLVKERGRFKSWTEFARRIGCNRPNLMNAIRTHRDIPREAIAYLGMKRVGAYVKADFPGDAI